MRAATLAAYAVRAADHISIHAAREGGDFPFTQTPIKIPNISIHAAREGGDIPFDVARLIGLLISIHAAREGGDLLLG